VNDLIAALRPSLVVELGTHFGESYFGMCQAVQENGVSCKCYAVDTWQGDPHAGHYDESVFTEVNAYNQRHYRLFSTLLRTTFDDAKENFGDGTVDLLHIDGVRTYDAIRHDFENWFPKVRPGGVVLLHDTAARHEDFQVWKLWEELARQYPHLEFHHSGGLGVLQKPGAAGGSGESVHAVLSASTSNQDFVRHYYAVQADLLERRRHAESLGGSERDAAVAERDAALMRQEHLSAEVRNLQAERVAVVADNRRTHGINDSLANEIASLKSSLAASQARIGRLEDATKSNDSVRRTSGSPRS
jgi:Methyltransferase domain